MDNFIDKKFYLIYINIVNFKLYIICGDVLLVLVRLVLML